jgi:hypothetical protein
MKHTSDLNKHRVRFISHSLTTGLLCVAAFVWATKNIAMSYALLGSAGLFALAAKREMNRSESGQKPAEPIKWNREIFRL